MSTTRPRAASVEASYAVHSTLPRFPLARLPPPPILIFCVSFWIMSAITALYASESCCKASRCCSKCVNTEDVVAVSDRRVLRCALRIGNGRSGSVSAESFPFQRESMKQVRKARKWKRKSKEGKANDTRRRPSPAPVATITTRGERTSRP